MEGLFVVGLLLLVAAGAYWGWYQKKKRREGLAFAARNLGLEYSQVDTRGCLDLPFTLLGKGDGRGTENGAVGIVAGRSGPGVRLLVLHGVDLLRRPSLEVLPSLLLCRDRDRGRVFPLSIVRENLLTRLADAVGLDDISFETQEFNDAFNVKAKDRRFASDLIDQRMMVWLLSSAPGFGSRPAVRGCCASATGASRSS